MKQLAILALALGLSTATHAIPFEIPGTGQDTPKNGTGGTQPNANNDASNFFRLENGATDFIFPTNSRVRMVLAGFQGLLSLEEPRIQSLFRMAAAQCSCLELHFLGLVSFEAN